MSKEVTVPTLISVGCQSVCEVTGNPRTYPEYISIPTTVIVCLGSLSGGRPVLAELAPGNAHPSLPGWEGNRPACHDRRGLQLCQRLNMSLGAIEATSDWPNRDLRMSTRH